MREKFSRYTFTFLEALDPSALVKLVAVSDKIFIFLPHNTQSVPIPLVSVAQRKGKDLKWVISAGENTLQSALSFSLGVWHERAPIEIEFVVASNEESLDPFIAFINAVGRKCLRVRVSDVLDNHASKDEITKITNGFHPELLKNPKTINIEDLKQFSLDK